MGYIVRRVAKSQTRLKQLGMRVHTRYLVVTLLFTLSFSLSRN